LQFSDKRLQTFDRGDVGAQRVNYAPKFQLPQYGRLSAAHFVFLEENFPIRRTFPDRLKFRGRGSLPLPCRPVTTPLGMIINRRAALSNVVTEPRAHQRDNFELKATIIRQPAKLHLWMSKTAAFSDDDQCGSDCSQRCYNSPVCKR